MMCGKFTDSMHFHIYTKIQSLIMTYFVFMKLRTKKNIKKKHFSSIGIIHIKKKFLSNQVYMKKC